MNTFKTLARLIGDWSGEKSGELKICIRKNVAYIGKEVD